MHAYRVLKYKSVFGIRLNVLPLPKYSRFPAEGVRVNFVQH